MRTAAALAALLLALGAGQALARAYGVEDLLATESLDAAAFSPTGDWAIFARTRAWKDGARFDHGGRNALALTRLDLLPLAPSGPVRPLFDQEPNAGYALGPTSPSGRWVLVYRLQDHRFTAGVVEVAKSQVRWLEGTADYPVFGRVAAWRSDDQLLLVQRAPGDLPRQLAMGWSAAEYLPKAWAAQAAGQQASVSVWRSGAGLKTQPLPPAGRLVAVDPRTGDQTPLLSGEILDLELSPDGRFVALFRNAERLQPTAKQAVYPAFPSRRRSLILLDLKTGHLREPCADCDFHLRFLAWSSKSEELLAARRLGEAPQLVRINAQTGETTALPMDTLTLALSYTGERAPLVAAQWLDATPLVFARPQGGRADWYALTRGRPPRNLTAGLSSPPGRSAWVAGGVLHLQIGTDLWVVAPSGKVLLQAAGASQVSTPQIGGGARLTASPPPPRLARVGDALTGLQTGGPRVGKVAPSDRILAGQGSKALVLSGEPSGVGQVKLLETGRPALPALTLNPDLVDISPARILPVSHKGPDGETLTSWLYLPPAREGGVKPALIVVPYPGDVYPEPPRSTLPGELRLTTNPQVLVGAGYAVLLPSLPFRREAGEPMAGLTDQILAVVDAAIATGEVDGARLALFGHSFGGYAAMATATQTSRFKAIIAMAGISDLVSYWGVLPPHALAAPEDGEASSAVAGLTEAGHPHTAAPPWIDPRRFVRNSPLFSAGEIRTPLLLIHGDQDEVAFNQSQEMFNALYRQGKDAEMAIYWGEGHSVISPANVRDLYDRVFAFLARALRPGSETFPKPTG